MYGQSNLVLREARKCPEVCVCVFGLFLTTGRIVGWTDKEGGMGTNGGMGEYRVRQTDGGMDGQGTDGRMEGWTDKERTDGLRDGRI